MGPNPTSLRGVVWLSAVVVWALLRLDAVSVVAVLVMLAAPATGSTSPP